MFERNVQFYEGAVLRGLPGVSVGTWAHSCVSVQIYVHLCEARVIHLPPHMYKLQCTGNLRGHIVSLSVGAIFEALSRNFQ